MSKYNLSDKKNITPLSPQCRKTIYNSQEEAMEMIRYLNENRTGKEIRTYQCPVCGFWHLTSKIRK
jgi:hypothetical protein